MDASSINSVNAFRNQYTSTENTHIARLIETAFVKRLFHALVGAGYPADIHLLHTIYTQLLCK